MQTRSYLLHTNGPALWPEHKPLAEVKELERTTPDLIWSGTYQGIPTPSAGYIFKRKWWRRERRYDITDSKLVNIVWARYISFDTASKEEEESDHTGYTVADLLPDYHLLVRQVRQKKLEFPDLTEEIEAVARRWNFDEKLHGILIEDKSSGISAIQTIKASTDEWLKKLIIPFAPAGVSKVKRAELASAWCKAGCVWLPFPSASLDWLIDFEDELFNFPSVAHDDRTDSFTQLILYLEHILAEGFRAREGKQ